MNELAIKNKAIYEWYIHNNQACNDPEATWMDAAKFVLKKFVEMDYIQACRNINPKPVRKNIFLRDLLKWTMYRPIRTNLKKNHVKISISHLSKLYAT